MPLKAENSHMQIYMNKKVSDSEHYQLMDVWEEWWEA